MRILLAIVLAAAALWGGYWYVGATQTEKAVRGWLEDRAAEGWVANYEDVSTIGFPNRFDTTITAPELADPDTGLAWSAPFFQILALSYQPNHVILVWPNDQTLATPFETLTVESNGMRASARVQPTNNLALDRATIETGAVQIRSTLGWAASMTSGQLAIRQTPEVDLSYDIAATLVDMTPPEAWSRLVARAGLPSQDLGQVTLAATVGFDAPWDLDALDTARPQPTRIAIDEARASWGQLQLQAGGAVDVDSQGRLSGEITIRATNWRAMLDLAVDTGALPRDMADVTERGLELLSRFSGNRDAIDVPLGFRNGNMTLGGLIPLGPGPRIVLR